MTDTDRELLALAARVWGCCVRWEVDYGCYSFRSDEHGLRRWNPLADDGDALRLAVKLRMEITFDDFQVAAHESDWYERSGDGAGAFERRGMDDYAATRRAIVRAAAEIGRRLATADKPPPPAPPAQSTPPA